MGAGRQPPPLGLLPLSRWFERIVEGDRAALYEQDIASMALRKVSTAEDCHLYPHYLPGGASILFTQTGCRFSWHVVRLDINTKRYTRLTQGNVRDHEPVPDPAGQRFAYTRVYGDWATVLVQPFSGGAPVTVARLKGEYTPQVAWSKDGRRLLWLAHHEVWWAEPGKTRPQHTKISGEL